MSRSICNIGQAAFVIVGVIAMTTACGSRSQTPTMPSEVQTPVVVAPVTPTPVPTGATIVGTVSTNASTSQLGMRACDVPFGLMVTVVGTTAVAPVDSNGTFTLTGVPPIDVVLNFSGPGISTTLPLGMITAAEHVQIDRRRSQ
jgi:hypothetical protein